MEEKKENLMSFAAGFIYTIALVTYVKYLAKLEGVPSTQHLGKYSQLVSSDTGTVVSIVMFPLVGILGYVLFRSKSPSAPYILLGVSFIFLIFSILVNKL
jgi:hypothetical protein